MGGRVVTVRDREWWWSAFSPPHPALRGFLRGYVGYWENGIPARMRTLPSRTAVVIINLGEPLRLTRMPGHGFTGGRYGSFAAGLHDGYGLYEHPGRQCGIQLDLTPLGAYTLLGVPMTELANVVVGLPDLLGPAAGAMVERLAALGDWADRFDLLDGFLLRRMEAGPVPAPEVAEAWRLLAASSGLVQIGALADEVGWSRKHLVNRFKEQIGLSPKVTARVLRFQRAVELLSRGVPSWVDLAMACGYYDQAHMNREFRALSGCTPAGLIPALRPQPTEGA